LRGAAKELASGGKIDASSSDTQLQLLRETAGEQWGQNPFTGGPLRRERSPGNVSVREIRGEPRLCWYDEDGVEIELVKLPPAPVTTQPVTPSAE